MGASQTVEIERSKRQAPPEASGLSHTPGGGERKGRAGADGRAVEPEGRLEREHCHRPGAHLPVKEAFVGGIKEDAEEHRLSRLSQQYGNLT